MEKVSIATWMGSKNSKKGDICAEWERSHFIFKLSTEVLLFACLFHLHFQFRPQFALVVHSQMFYCKKTSELLQVQNLYFDKVDYFYNSIKCA